jgi:hypothetical protein
MAIHINTVYQTVQALANKEQRGYITPQEFNLFAKRAQMDIFEQYFYDINQFKRMPGNDTEHSDMVGLIQDKIDQTFLSFTQDLAMTNAGVTLPNDFYRLGAVDFQHLGIRTRVDMMKRSDVEELTNSGPLTKPRISGFGAQRRIHNPVGYLLQNRIYVRPLPFEFDNTGYSIRLSYYRAPKIPKWTYIVVNEKALYNETAEDRQHFELHESEETDLVLKILQYAGVSMKEFGIVQAAGQAEANIISQQKQ